MQFYDYELSPERSEISTYDVFRWAIRDASNPVLRDTAVEEGRHFWTYGSAKLEMQPDKGNPQQVPFLTWGYWHTALTGIDNFRRFYRKLNFDFEVFVLNNVIAAGYLEG